MIKKLTIPLAVLAAVMLLSAPAMAGITGTAHELTVGSREGCATCHIPHKSVGARLWPADMTGLGTALGTVGQLCFYCHGTGGGAGLVDAVNTYITDVAALGDGEFSHGRVEASIPTGDAVDTTLEHTGAASEAGAFQCTTCHNVHDDTNKPLLRDDIDVLCARCHTGRMFINGGAPGAPPFSQGDWGIANRGVNNPGSHPVGDDVVGDFEADTPIDIAAVFESAYDGGSATTHNLGGHLTDGGIEGVGGVTCVTCHSPHGVQADGTAGQQTPVVNLLTIAQGGTGSIMNGDGDARNALCEGCHGDPAATSIDPSSGATYNHTATNRPNPGATSYTHPVDDLGASGTAGVTAFPAGWPTGSAPGTNVLPGPICESCHTPHPGNNAASRASIAQPANTAILRTLFGDLCVSCHALEALGAGHHPANVPLGNMADADIDDGLGDTTLNCSDCHSGGAHNWAAYGVGLDPDWEPAGNGRGLAAAERVTAGASKECEDCHYDGNTYLGPTNNSADDGSDVSHTYGTGRGARTSASYQDTGTGTHYLGDPAGGFDYADGSINALTDTWSGGGWSRFDGVGGHVVCESCHDIEPDKNVAGTALLLEYYNDGEAAGANDPSELCEGCHGGTPGGGTPHPMTGDIVSRTGVALSTTASWLRSPILGNATFPAANQVNCDSCHQPHDADSDSGTYILDTHSSYDATVTTAPSGDGEVPTNYRVAPTDGLDYSGFCDSCHTYLN